MEEPTEVFQLLAKMEEAAELRQEESTARHLKLLVELQNEARQQEQRHEERMMMMMNTMMQQIIAVNPGRSGTLTFPPWAHRECHSNQVHHHNFHPNLTIYLLIPTVLFTHVL